MVEKQLKSFTSNDKVMQTASGHVTTNEGSGAWLEAISVLESQWKLPPLRWSETLSLAAEDHCSD